MSTRHQRPCTVKVWSVDADEPDEPNWPDGEPEDIASDFAEWHYRDDYPSEQTIRVRYLSGRTHTFKVTAVQTVAFRAEELEQP